MKTVNQFFKHKTFKKAYYSTNSPHERLMLVEFVESKKKEFGLESCTGWLNWIQPVWEISKIKTMSSAEIKKFIQTNKSS
jgi:hypothetical protein